MRNLTLMRAVMRRSVLGLSLAVIPPATVLLPQPVSALPKSCVIRNYYNNAALDTQVGMRSSCPGTQKWGKITKFVELETVDLVPDGPTGPGGGGGLPCEFLASGCPNLPVHRFQ
jgi:hypothetical protein